jgi:hypothetical protein
MSPVCATVLGIPRLYTPVAATGSERVRAISASGRGKNNVDGLVGASPVYDRPERPGQNLDVQPK